LTVTCTTSTYSTHTMTFAQEHIYSFSTDADASSPDTNMPSTFADDEDTKDGLLRGTDQDDELDNVFDYDKPVTGGKKSSSGSRKGPGAADKRATHNAIERARRESLNGRFMILAEALPSMANVKRPSKSIIVNKALDFVFEAQVKEHALIKENNDLRCQIDQLRSMLGMPPLPPPAPLPTGNKSSTTANKNAASYGRNDDRSSFLTLTALDTQAYGAPSPSDPSSPALPSPPSTVDVSPSASTFALHSTSSSGTFSRSTRAQADSISSDSDGGQLQASRTSFGTTSPPVSTGSPSPYLPHATQQLNLSNLNGNAGGYVPQGQSFSQGQATSHFGYSNNGANMNSSLISQQHAALIAAHFQQHAHQQNPHAPFSMSDSFLAAGPYPGHGGLNSTSSTSFGWPTAFGTGVTAGGDSRSLMDSYGFSA